MANDPMNGYHNGGCRTNGQGSDYYCIPNDTDGNSFLTGDGKGKSDSSKTFTLVEMEVFLLTVS